MKSILKLAFAGLLQLFLLSPALAQDLPDSSFVARVTGSAYELYLNSLQKDAPIFNGRIYRPYPFRLENEGHSYFESSKLINGWVIYEGKLFENQQLMYDLVRDELVLLYHDNSSRIILPRDRVDGFSVLDHTFIRVKVDSSLKGLPAAGYYDLLHNGKISLLARRAKKITETATQGGLQRSVSASNRYYLFQDSLYYNVRNKKGLLKLLKQNRLQNQQFIKSNKLDFRRDKENAMIRLVKFYDTGRP